MQKRQEMVAVKAKCKTLLREVCGEGTEREFKCPSLFSIQSGSDSLGSKQLLRSFNCILVRFIDHHFRSENIKPMTDD